MVTVRVFMRSMFDMLDYSDALLERAACLEIEKDRETRDKKGLRIDA